MNVSPGTTRVGFIGLGIMGAPMAGHLVRAGYKLTVHNRSRGPVEELVRRGAADGGSPAGVARASEVVITMLPDASAVEQVVFGGNGTHAGMRPGSVLVDMSTISPGSARELAARLAGLGARMLDAPVSGGQEGARAASLSIMVGGDQGVFEDCRTLLEVMGKDVVYIGTAGAGQLAKACNQIIVALTIQAVAEALTLARASGVDPATVRRALMGGFAQSRVLELHGQRMIERNFRPGGRVHLHHKDLGLALAAGRDAGVPLLGTALVHELFGALRATGRGDLDHSALACLLDQPGPGRPAAESSR